MLFRSVRELFEELGISADAEELRFIGFHEGRYEGTFNGKLFKDHEKSAVFLYEKPVEDSAFTLQESEVESVLWMELHEIERAVREKRPDFCLFQDEIELLISCLEGRER